MKAQFIEINNEDQLTELFEVSKTKPVVFFKHSISCSISTNVLEEVSNVDSTVFLIVIQDSRQLSQALADKTGIHHQSPQAIIIRNEKPVYSASHYDVTSADITAALVKEQIG